MDNLELIEKYLNEELSANELMQFESLQKTDSEFAEEVQLAVTLNADFNVQKKKRWQAMLKEQGAKIETPVRQLTPRKSAVNWMRSIAAVFVLGLGLALAWMMFSSPDMNSLASAQLENIYEDPTSFMGEDTGTVEDSNWENAIKAYEEENFSLATIAIEKSIEKNSTNLGEKYFYLGVSQMYEDAPDYEVAMTNLKKGKELNRLFKSQADWFMSLACLKLNKKEKAKALLQEVVNADDWGKAEAIALLNQL